MKDIPVHQLLERTSSGLDISYFAFGDQPKEKEPLGAHRDDHYLFFLVEKGNASLMIDFHEVKFCENSLYYILPGQVHHRIRNEVAGGWFAAIDTQHIPPGYRAIFENQLLLQQPYQLSNYEMKQYRQVLSLLHEKHAEDAQSPFYIPILQSLIQSFTGMVAANFSKTRNPEKQLSRPGQISLMFKKLLLEQIRITKSPSAYAALLNVSESYLNEVLKKTTGFPVSYWITQEVMLEAKRLLFYSDLNVKEIAHTLGYDDHTYFSRLFKKSAAITPLEFRDKSRK
ncbi:helix-turn-helix domain-containing protein [Mucilaginibacter celer]|uniref:Helix-turn-helix domain-containing protein n=1 Tax=Mucilaginibacter celer TaxID=2305508 RepID=A0A494W6Q2_9SPHI|nr:helix-turn-helix domain-containing protein [Mucilaginibacter celer]AYL98982.1 helix-turn-helix domain-containing protein [Mucilaginibacter celer]